MGWNHCRYHKIAYRLGMTLEKFPDVQKLSPSEKLMFVSELWNDLEAHQLDVPVSPEIVTELDRRMAEFQKNPAQFTTWENAKSRLLTGNK